MPTDRRTVDGTGYEQRGTDEAPRWVFAADKPAAARSFAVRAKGHPPAEVEALSESHARGMWLKLYGFAWADFEDAPPGEE